MITVMGLVALLFVVGVLLLCIELFIIPGFGVVGLLGAGSLIAAVAVAWWKLGGLEAGVALALGTAVIASLLWYLPRSRAGKAMVLAEVQSAIATLPAVVAVGAEGLAATPLRPSGVVSFAEHEVDVVSEGLFVDAGTRVRVTRVEGSRVFVEPVSNYQGV